MFFVNRQGPRRARFSKSIESGFACMIKTNEGKLMDVAKRKRREKAGWKVGTAKVFLGLSQGEASYVELKLFLAKELLKRRKSLGLSQVDMAKRIRSNQSRVAKMEAGDPSVSLDLLVRSLLALGDIPLVLQKAFSP